jgi:hypothetical protein
MCRRPVLLKFYRLLLAGLLSFSLLSHAAIFWRERGLIASAYGDFIIFYTGARLIYSGRGEQLYDLSLQAKEQEPFGVAIREGPLPYNHLPHELLVFLPLAWLPYPYAYALWSAVNGMLLIAVYKLLLPFVDAGNRVVLGGLLIAFYPTGATLLHGQDSILSLALFTAAFACLKGNREWAAGMILAFGLYKPQLVLPIAAVLSVKCRLRAMLGFGITAFGLAAVSLAMIGWTGFAGFFQLISWMEQTHYTLQPASMANIRGLAALAGLDSRLAGTTVILLTIYLGLFLWAVLLWKGEWKPARIQFELAFAHLIVVSLLVSHHLYPHDLTLLLIPLTLMFNHASNGCSRALWAGRAFLVLLLLFYAPLAPMWLMKENLFAWVAAALIGLAVIIARENSHHSRAV